MIKMLGYQSIRKTASLVSDALERCSWEQIFFPAMIGLLSGVFAGAVRLHLGLAGHKILLWLPFVLGTRIIFKWPAGCSIGAFGAVIGNILSGDSFGSAAIIMPLAVFCGGFIDIAIKSLQSRNFLIHLAVMSVMGANFNILLFGVRSLCGYLFRSHNFAGLCGVEAMLASYAFFGFLAGMTGAIAGRSLSRLRRKNHSKP